MLLVRCVLGIGGLCLLTLAALFKPAPKEWIVYQEAPSWKLYTMQSDGSESRQITNHDFETSVPRWAANGEWIVYGVRETDLRWYLYRTRLDGDHTQRLIDRPFFGPLSISPDGQWIAFSSIEGTGLELFKVRIDGSALQQLTTDVGDIGIIHWSPDGKWIGYISRQDFGANSLYRIQPDGSDRREIATGLWIDNDFSWSPDSKWLAFATAQNENVDIFRVQVDGSNLTRVTNSLSIDTNPSWSPDGNFLVYFSGNVSGSLERIRPDGRDHATLTTGILPNVDFTWSPDSEWVTFSGIQQGSQDLFRVNIDQLIVETLTADRARQQFPTWSPALESEWNWRWIGYGGGSLMLAAAFVIRRRKSMDIAWERGHQTRHFVPYIQFVGQWLNGFLPSFQQTEKSESRQKQRTRVGSWNAGTHQKI